MHTSWVFSSLLPASQQSGHRIYVVNPAKKQAGETWSITYGDGSSSSGTVYTDTVSIGATTVTGQAVEAANTISAQFASNLNDDGLLGLAFDSINTGKAQFKSHSRRAHVNLSQPPQTKSRPS